MIKKYFIGISIVLLAVISTYANTISINFYKDINNVKYGRISTNSFGVALEDSVTDGWIN